MTGRSNTRGIGHRDPKPDNIITVEVIHRPNPATRDRLVDLLIELLDAQRQSGGRSK
jgi:hypothetical protein